MSTTRSLKISIEIYLDGETELKAEVAFGPLVEACLMSRTIPEGENLGWPLFLNQARGAFVRYEKERVERGVPTGGHLW